MFVVYEAKLKMEGGEPGYTKIGYCLFGMLKDRLINIQTNCPFGVEIKAIKKFRSRRRARSYEKTVHNKLKAAGRWKRGEWFSEF